MSNEKELSVYGKLAKARVELQKRNLNKSGLNKFAGFKYYELADFIPTINSIFMEVGLLSVFLLDESFAYLKIIDVDSYESIEFMTPTEIIEQKGMTPIQALGSKHTYLKRYLYLNALEIVEGDVIDSLDNTKEEVKKEPKEKLKPKLATKEQIEAMNDLMDSNRVNAMLNLYKIKSIEEMTEENATVIISKLVKETKKEVTNINDV